MTAAIGNWEHKFAQVTEDIQIHYIDVGPRDATPLVLLHGWPDIGFGWRKQIEALSAKYRVIVPDHRGHGHSTAPKDASQYGTKALTGDLARLLDILEIPKAVFIGHDWGGALVYRMALYHPERVIGIASVCTPFIPPSREYVDIDDLVKANPSLAYQKFFAHTEPLSKLLDSAPRQVFTVLFRRHDEGSSASMVEVFQNLGKSDHPVYTVHSDLITDAELDVYTDAYKKTGFQSTLNWYATRRIDFETEKELPMFIQHKALYIGAQNDRVLKPEMAAHMPKLMPNLEMTVIDEAGHWILWEQPEKVTEALVTWLAKL